MRILIINLRIGTGSVGRIVSDLYHGIVENGDNCKVAYARGKAVDIPIEDTIKICSKFEVNKHALLTRLFGNTAFWSKKSTISFLKEVDKFKPEIIHIHGIYGYYINMEVLFNYISENNIKLLSTLHSCWDFTGHCCYFDYASCNQWKTECENCKQKSSYPKTSFLDNTHKNFIKKRRLYGKVDCTIVTPSRWMANLARQSFLKDKEIVVIPNGIDQQIYYSSAFKKNYNYDNPIILCVANVWDRRKGLADIMELGKIIEGIQIIVVGLKKSQIKNLPSNIIGIERTNSMEELAILYSNATVFFNPTYEDNYPTVNLEAISCKTPVITYNTGGSGEVLCNNAYGITIEKKDYKTLINYTWDVYTGKISIDFSNLESISNKNMIKNYISLYKKYFKE